MHVESYMRRQYTCMICIYNVIMIPLLNAGEHYAVKTDVGSGRTAVAAVASEPAAMDAVLSAPARSK